MTHFSNLQQRLSWPGLPVAMPLVVATVVALAPAAAVAASASTTFSVTATVVDACSVSATNLAFGAYDPAATTDKTATSTISVQCSLGTAYTISLDNGGNASGSTRRMASGANRLSYEMYRDVGNSLIFGTVANLLGVSGVGTGVAVPTTVYGVIPKSQSVGTGSYADQITVTIEY